MFCKFQRIYCANIHCLKKLDSVSKAPLHEHFYETTRGLLTIRSTGQDGVYIDTCDRLIDESQKGHFLLQAAFGWEFARLFFSCQNDVRKGHQQDNSILNFERKKKLWGYWITLTWRSVPQFHIYWVIFSCVKLSERGAPTKHKFAFYIPLMPLAASPKKELIEGY